MELVIDIDSVTLRSINKRLIQRKAAPSDKYRGFVKVSKAFINSQAYRNFKKTLFYHLQIPSKVIKPPYAVHIYLETYLDIDNPLKPIIDSLNKTVIEDDKFIHELKVYKKPRKRGHPSSLKVYVGSLA